MRKKNQKKKLKKSLNKYFVSVPLQEDACAELIMSD